MAIIKTAYPFLQGPRADSLGNGGTHGRPVGELCIVLNADDARVRESLQAEGSQSMVVLWKAKKGVR